MEKLNFNDCTLSTIEEVFKVMPTKQNQALTNWISANAELTDFDKETVRRLCKLLQDNVAHWNEYDLSLHFIGPMFSAVNFTQPFRFNLFAQRNLEAEVQQIKLMGRVDEVIASGYRDPKIPFFAFNEYKKEKNQAPPDLPKGEEINDPAGQVLAAMLVGQQQNQAEGNDFPIYGCYIIGPIWRFVVLEGKKYAISKRFDSTEYDDALQMLRILLELKEYCLQRTAHIIVED